MKDFIGCLIWAATAFLICFAADYVIHFVKSVWWLLRWFV